MTETTDVIQVRMIGDFKFVYRALDDWKNACVELYWSGVRVFTTPTVDNDDLVALADSSILACEFAKNSCCDLSDKVLEALEARIRTMNAHRAHLKGIR
jgi:hypothetical protein